MRIGVLGPLAVTAKDGRRTEIGGPRVRALLEQMTIDEKLGMVQGSRDPA